MGSFFASVLRRIRSAFGRLAHPSPAPSSTPPAAPPPPAVATAAPPAPPASAYHPGAVVGRYSVSILTGTDIKGTPRMRVSSGQIRVGLNGPDVASKRVALLVLDGGGGFPPGAGRTPLRSETYVTSDGHGEFDVPDFVLGAAEGMNRILVQSDFANEIVAITGTYENTELVAVDPVSAKCDGFSHKTTQIVVRVRDRKFPSAYIEGVPVAVEIREGGGWIDAAGAFVRAASALTGIDGTVTITHRFSSRDESTTLRYVLPDAPRVSALTVTAGAHHPRLLSCESTTRTETVDDVATGWLTKVCRIGTYDAMQDAICGGGGPDRPYVDIRARKTGGTAKLIPSPESGWGGVTSLAVRPTQRGNFDLELFLPDFPDDPIRHIKGQAIDRLSGQDVQLTLPGPHGGIFVQDNFGGVLDLDHGVEIKNVKNDVQFVPPNTASALPLEVTLATYPLSNPQKRKLKAVHLRFKVRMTPVSSMYDDPGDPHANEHLSGTVSLNAPGGGLDLLDVLFMPPASVQTVKVFFNANQDDFDHMVEITAKVTISEDGGGGTWVDTDYETTLLGRAFFFRPRMNFTHKDQGGAFVPIDDEAIIPCPIVKPDGSILPHDPKRDIYVEFHTSQRDTRQTMTARVAGGQYDHTIELTPVSSTGSTADRVFRSTKPLVCYLDSPATYGLSAFTFPATHNFIHVGAPYTLQAFSDDLGHGNNPKPVTFFTAERPVSFLNVETTAQRAIRPALPAPRIQITKLDRTDGVYPIVMDAGKPCVEISGMVHDLVADITRGGGADIKEIDVNGTAVQLQVTTAIPLDYWPVPYHGDFTARVPLRAGMNVVTLTARNLLGGTGTTVLLAELFDERNDFDNPRAAGMTARVTLASEPDHTDLADLLRVHYRCPHLPGTTTGGLAGHTSADVESFEAYPKVARTHGRTMTLYRFSGIENGWASDPFLLVSDQLDPADIAKAEAAKVPFIKHKAGSRLRVSGKMPHPLGDMPMQNFGNSEIVEMNLLVMGKSGWETRNTISPGDEFTIEAHVVTPIPLNAIEVNLAAADRLGQVLDGTNRRLRITLAASSVSGTAGWISMSAYEDPTTHHLVAATSVKAISRSEDPPANAACLRLLGGGTLSVGHQGIPVGDLFPVDHAPRRQEVAGQAAAPEAATGGAALAGARHSVVARTGEMVFAEHDATLESRGLQLAFTRVYRSFDDYDGPMGCNWTHGFDCWLQRLDDKTYRLVTGDGRWHEFKRASVGGNFEPPPGVYALLEETSARECHLRWRSGVEQVFVARGAEGYDYLQLAATYNRVHDRLGLAYDQAGMLAYAEDPLLQRLYLRHDGDVRVETVGDDTGRRWTYAYHDGTGSGLRGDLMTVTSPAVTIGQRVFPAGKMHAFRYEKPAPDAPKRHKLNALVDPRGQPTKSAGGNAVLSTEYKADGRVDKQTYGKGAPYSFDYLGDTTVVKNRLGDTKRVVFKSGARAELATLPAQYIEVENGRDLTTKFEHNSQGELSKVTTPLGAVMETTYDDADPNPRVRGNLRTLKRSPIPGRPTDILDATGTNDFHTDPSARQPSSLTWSFEYEPRFQQIRTEKDPLGRVTTYVYDYERGGRSHGDMIECQMPPISFGGAGGQTQQRIAHLLYNNFGHVSKAIDPEGVTTTFRYYAAASPGGGFEVDPFATPAIATGHTARIFRDAIPADPSRSARLAPPVTREEHLRYDGWGNVVETTTPAGITQETWNELGQLVKSVDAEGFVQEFWYDENDDLAKRTEVVTDLHLPVGVPVTSGTLTHTFAFDRLHNLERAVIDATGLNLVHQLDYDAEERLEYDRSPSSLHGTGPDDPKRITQFKYNARGLLEWRIRAPGAMPQQSVQYGYDDDGTLERLVDAQGSVVTFTHDAWGHRIGEADSAVRQRSIAYDFAGRATRLTVSGPLDAAGNTGTLSDVIIYRDEAGRELAHAEMAFRWSGSSKTDIGGGRHITTFEYDACGRRTAVVSHRGARTEYWFTGLGQLQRTLDPVVGETVNTWDAAGFLKKVKVPGPGATPIELARSYDKVGRLTSKESFANKVTRYYYDTLGRRRLAEDPYGNRIFSEYDGASRPVRQVREMRVNGRRFDIPGTTDNPEMPGSPDVTRFEYDDNGNMLAVHDATSRVALSHTYGAHEERLTSTARGFRGAETHKYDYWPNGQIKTITTPDRLTITHAYDKGGLLVSRTIGVDPAAAPPPVIQGTTRQTFRYDGLARCVQCTDETPTGSHTATRRFDSLGHLWEDAQTDPVTGSIGVTSTWNDAGELATTEYPANGPKLQHVFTPAGAISSISDGQRIASYFFTGEYLMRRVYPNGLALDVAYEPTGRLNTYGHFDYNNGVVDHSSPIYSEETIQWTDNGMPEVTIDHVRKKARAMLYDSFYRNTVTFDNIDPTSLAHPKAGQTGAWSNFDGRGNLAQIHSGNLIPNPFAGSGTVTVRADRYVTRQFNDANQITSATEEVNPGSNVVLDVAQTLAWSLTSGLYNPHPPESFTYDDRGNLAGEATRKYSYDVFNRLIAVTDQAGTSLATYAYDAFDRRVVKNDLRFVYHGSKLMEERDATGNRKRYLYSAEGLVAFERVSAAGTAHRYYVHEDRSGGIRVVSDDSHRIVEQYGYDPFGAPKIYDPAMNEITLANSIGLRFFSQGQYYDEETGLYQVGARTYHPRLQRMLQRDPFPWDEDTNGYSYARNNLHAFKDPSGNIPVWLAPLVVVAIEGALLGAAYAAFHQYWMMAEGGQPEGFSWGEVLEGAAIGAVVGAMCWYMPYAIVPLSGYGIFTGVNEWRSGYHAAGFADVAFSLFALAGMGMYARARAARLQPTVVRLELLSEMPGRLRSGMDLPAKRIGEIGLRAAERTNAISTRGVQWATEHESVRRAYASLADGVNPGVRRGYKYLGSVDEMPSAKTAKSEVKVGQWIEPKIRDLLADKWKVLMETKASASITGPDIKPLGKGKIKIGNIIVDYGEIKPGRDSGVLKAFLQFDNWSVHQGLKGKIALIMYFQNDSYTGFDVYLHSVHNL